MESATFRAMNSDILLMAGAGPGQAAAGFREARAFIEASERRFTRFSEQSELSALNRGAGEWFHASAELFEVLSESLELFHKTRGLFDPSILPDLQRAGYTRSMDEVRLYGAEPQQDEQPHAPHFGFGNIDLQAGANLVRLPEGMRIDLGGIAKGWIAEQAARIVSRYAEACAVSAGGDMFLIGYPDGQDYWEIGLEDPRDPTQDLALLRAQQGAVATSSVVKRAWKQGEAKRHHLIDPRTGEPAETPWLSVTVMAGRAAEAETFAKAFLIAGEEEARRLSEENPGLTVLAIDRSGQVNKLGHEEILNVHQ